MRGGQLFKTVLGTEYLRKGAFGKRSAISLEANILRGGKNQGKPFGISDFRCQMSDFKALVVFGLPLPHI
jgi:hypothetical protein